ncbi:MAG: hypothetical protein Q7W44_01755 [Coriobacteriia bacterium]|nr:hypothetical protein [Coriobacteriia bacterium]
MLRRVVYAVLVIVLFTLPVACDDADLDTVDESLESSADEIAVPQPVDPSVLLTPADVERVTGLTALSVVPYDPAVGAGGDVNIADETGQLVAMLIVEGPEQWGAWLTDGFTVREPVSPPVGDESFIGPSPDVNEAVYIFGFLKDDTAIVIDTFFDPGGNGTILSTEDLRALAEVVEGRL